MNATDIASAITTEDASLAAAVAQVLSMKASLEAWGVWLTVSGGRVTLHGEVPGWRQRDSIEHAIHLVEGVKEIKNWMTVRPETIAREIRQAIADAWASPA